MPDRLIGIGDIHGCAKALASLVEAIQPTDLDTLIFLGDYIDPGPNSRGVLGQVRIRSTPLLNAAPPAPELGGRRIALRQPVGNRVRGQLARL
jgi:hypothetical protein